MRLSNDVKTMTIKTFYLFGYVYFAIIGYLTLTSAEDVTNGAQDVANGVIGCRCGNDYFKNQSMRRLDRRTMLTGNQWVRIETSNSS